MRFHVVSFTTGVWYYQTESLAAQEGSASAKSYTQAPVTTGLKLGFTKSFGTIAFASLILFLLDQLRQLERRCRRQGLCGCLIAACIKCIRVYFEFLTRFALTFHSLSGEDFCTSGRSFLQHCKRHGFTAYSVDWLARMTLSFGAIILASLLAAITIMQVGDYKFKDKDDMHLVQCLVGLFAWIFAAFILNFLSGVLLNIIDASYSCLVLDLDNATQTGTYRRPAIAQAVLVKANPSYVLQTVHGTVPIQHVQVAVQSPGSQYAYGAAHPMAAQAYAQPSPANVSITSTNLDQMK